MILFIYTIRNFQYYSPELFKNLCAFVKSCSYDYIKINFNVVVDINIDDLIKICDEICIKLIISINNKDDIKLIRNKIDYIEIHDVSYYNVIHSSFKKIILNTNVQNFISLENKNKFNTILLNNLDTYFNWDEIGNILKQNNNLGIETDNKNNIFFSCFNINIFSISHEFNEIAFLNWSNVNNIEKKFDLKYNFNKIYKDKKKILITGITGQDGSNLVEYLLNLKNDDIVIFGTLRSIFMLKHENIKNFVLKSQFIPIILNLCDNTNTYVIFKNINPDYFYNCAAQTIVNISQDKDAVNTLLVNSIAPLNHLELIREHNKDCKYFSCGSSEEFGNICYTPQNLNHPMKPTNIYGISKMTTHYLIKYYRDNYNLFCCHGILYNHEGVKRDINFVTRKITTEIVKIKLDIDKNKIPNYLSVGNIFSKRDWSDSSDFIEAFWLILNHNIPDDYILSSGESHSVKEFIDCAFNEVDMCIRWDIDKKNPLNTKAYYNDILVVVVDKKFYREINNTGNFIGDNLLTKQKLNWSPKVTFNNLIKKMINNDMKLLK